MITKSGVYLIKNNLTEGFYGGSSVNMSSRWANHKKLASIGSDKCPHLYSAMRKYGVENFEIVPLLVCDKHNLELYEQKWLDINYGNPSCYNVSSNAKAPWRGRKMTDDMKKKLSASMMGRIPWNKGIERTDIEKYNISEATKLAMSKLDNSCSDETKDKLSIALQGRKFSEETRNKMSKVRKGKIPWNLGVRCSAQTKIDISISQKAKNIHIPQKLSEEDVKTIRKMYTSGTYSYNRLANLFGCSKRNISCVIHRITWSHVI